MEDEQSIEENAAKLNKTRRFADWLIAREEAKLTEEPIDRQMRMLKINTFLTALILLAVGGADYDAQVMNLIWFL